MLSQKYKRKHITLTLNTKVEILQRIDKGEKILDLAKIYGIGRATVHDIKKNRDKLLAYINTSECRPGRQTMKAGEYPQVENEVYKWFLEERAQNTFITGDAIREKAKFVYNKIMNRDDFKASDGWLDKFKKRFGIRLAPTGQEISIGTQEQFLHTIQELDLLPQQIYSANVSVLLWNHLPHKNMSLDHFTFVSCSNSTATHKLKLFLIGREDHTDCHDTQVVYKSESTLTPELLNEWFHQEFIPSVSEFLKTHNLQHKALLVLSNSPNCSNATLLKSSDGSIQVMFLNQNPTTKVSSKDDTISHAIKLHYKRGLMKKAVNQAGGIELFLSQYKLKDAILKLTSIWEEVTSNAIILSWIKIWPTHPLGLQNYQNEDLVNNTEFVDSVLHKYSKDDSLTEDEVTHWLSSDYEENMTKDTDEKLINNIKTEDTAVWAVDPLHSINNDDAINAISTCIKWCEENEVEPEDMVVLNRLREKMFAKTFSVKQEDMHTECQ